MFRSNPHIDRFIQFFSLPKYLLKILRHKDCNKGACSLASDFLTLFFTFKTFPDNYGPCRLWAIANEDWKYFYGSNYQSHQRYRLLHEVQPLEYRIIFDDKAVCERLCRAADVLTPRIHGIISPSIDYKRKLKAYFNNTIQDLLFIKPIRGSAGKGILLAKRSNDSIFIKSINELIPLHAFQLNETAIVQEAIRQDYRMAAFSSSSVNTIRVVTMLTKHDSVIILCALMRCGIGESYVDNISAGGLGVGIHLKSGALMEYGYDYKLNTYLSHPTSNTVFAGFIVPEWPKITTLAIKVQESFPFTRMLGMDIALQENGTPILVEVNESPDLLGMEMVCGPLLRDDNVLQAFGEYNLLVNRYQKELFYNLNRL